MSLPKAASREVASGGDRSGYQRGYSGYDGKRGRGGMGGTGTYTGGTGGGGGGGSSFYEHAAKHIKDERRRHG